MTPLTMEYLQSQGWQVKSGIVCKQLESPCVRLGWKKDGTLIIGYGEWPRKVTTNEYLNQILKLIKQ